MDLKNVSSHFRFGENWESYARIVDDARIAEAVKGLAKLIPAESIKGKQFLDIGCGSGLSMLAALRLGAASVKGVDIDADSVNTTRALLSHYAPGEKWSAEQASVFDINPENTGSFDIVHSWGVLHHTGDIWTAINKAAALVKPNGIFVIALYHKTPLCNFWRAEKKFYAHAKKWQQWVIRCVYKAAFLLRMVTLRKNPIAFISNYKSSRGMDWHHDVHDWLGGYPYESVLPDEVIAHMKEQSFSLERLFDIGTGKGIFGTGCDEYVFRRV